MHYFDLAITLSKSGFMLPYEMVPWCRVVVVITIAQLHSAKPELKFCAGSSPARGVTEIRDGEDL